MADEKTQFNADLDTSLFNLQQAEQTITALLKEGQVRIRPLEIERAREYLRKMLPLMKSFHVILTEFEFIAPEEKANE